MLIIPNCLTTVRLVLTPWIILAFISGRAVLALVLFLIAAATDFLDGAIARRYNLMSKFGALFDPIADKCLMSGVFLAFGITGVMPWWFVVLVLGRDVYLLLAAGIIWKFTSVRQFPPSGLGKASTFVQVSLATVVLAGSAFQMGFISPIAGFLMGIAVALIIGSGLDYTFQGIRSAQQF